MNFDWIVVGSGIAGSTAARILAEKGNRVLVLEKEKEPGGLLRECVQSDGLRIQKFGPHIFHTNDGDVLEFLSRFAVWRPYKQKALLHLDGEYIPFPFNLNSLVMLFGFRKANQLRDILTGAYGENATVSLADLRGMDDKNVRSACDSITDAFLRPFLEKHLGFPKGAEIPETFLKKVTIRLTRENACYPETFQAVPSDGFAEMIKKMLDHENIRPEYGVNAMERLRLQEGKVFLDGVPFAGKVVWTGSPDELFGYRFGELEYRTVTYTEETISKEYVQLCATLLTGIGSDIDRVTEYKHITGQKSPATVLVKEKYAPCKRGDVPVIPVTTEESAAVFERYALEAENYPQILLAGNRGQYCADGISESVSKIIKLLEKQ